MNHNLSIVCTPEFAKSRAARRWAYAVPEQFLCRYPQCIFFVMVGQGTFHTEAEREEHEIATHSREDIGWVGGKPLGAGPALASGNSHVLTRLAKVARRK